MVRGPNPKKETASSSNQLTCISALLLLVDKSLTFLKITKGVSRGLYHLKQMTGSTARATKAIIEF